MNLIEYYPTGAMPVGKVLEKRMEDIYKYLIYINVSVSQAAKIIKLTRPGMYVRMAARGVKRNENGKLGWNELCRLDSTLQANPLKLLEALCIREHSAEIAYHPTSD
jgi:hypothetical protein